MDILRIKSYRYLAIKLHHGFFQENFTMAHIYLLHGLHGSWALRAPLESASQDWQPPLPLPPWGSARRAPEGAVCLKSWYLIEDLMVI
jgi:hypothetical protein